MPVDYGNGPVGSDDLRERLERFSQQLGGRTVHVLRGDQSAPPPVPAFDPTPAPQQRSGCLGQFFPGSASPAAPPDPAVWQARSMGEGAHTQGLAADITVDGLTTREVSEAAARSGLFDGVGHQDAVPGQFAHTHVDIGGRASDGSSRLWMAAAAAGGALGATLAWSAFENQRRRAVGDS